MQAPPSLGALPLEASLWEVVLPGVPPDDAARAVGEFLACDALEVERLTSKGTRRMDARAAVITMETDRCAADGRRCRECDTSNGCSACHTCRPA